MSKLKALIKILVLLPLLLLALPIDAVLFSLANSCASCASFQQYLVSNFSIFNSLFVSVLGLFTLLARRRTSSYNGKRI